MGKLLLVKPYLSNIATEPFEMFQNCVGSPRQRECSCFFDDLLCWLARLSPIVHQRVYFISAIALTEL